MVVSASDAQNPLIGRSRDCSCLHRHHPEGPSLCRWRRSGRKLIGVCVEAVNNLTAYNTLEGDKKLYQLNGPLFFGSTTQFNSIFHPKEDPGEVILDFTNSRVMDHSALEAINALSDRYGSRGKNVYLRHLSAK